MYISANFGHRSRVLQGFMCEERWDKVHDKRPHLVQPRSCAERRRCWINQFNKDQGIQYGLAVNESKLGGELAVQCKP
jgi:hypothetical protein